MYNISHIYNYLTLTSLTSDTAPLVMSPTFYLPQELLQCRTYVRIPPSNKASSSVAAAVTALVSLIYLASHGSPWSHQSHWRTDPLGAWECNAADVRSAKLESTRKCQVDADISHIPPDWYTHRYLHIYIYTHWWYSLSTSISIIIVYIYICIYIYYI